MKRVYFFLATLLGLLSVLPLLGQTITVKAKVPAHWTNTITAWVWETDGDSYAVTPIKEGDWYSYTHTGASFNIIYRNGEDWTDAANQTVDITNIKTNTGFALSQTGAEKAVYTIVDCETGEDITNTDSVFANVLISQSDVELTILNDTLYPWVYDATNACITNSNKGIKYSSATLSLFYKSDYVTEFQVDWLSYNYSSHQPLQLYIDGVLIKTTSSSSYSTPRYYLPAGEHIITFCDSIGNSSSTNNYSRISNLRIREIQPLESVVLTENSKPITFTNDSIFPWTIEDGYIQNSNYGTAYSSSTFSTTFTVDTPSIFSYEKWVNRYDGNTSNASTYHTLKRRIQPDFLGYNWYYTNGWIQTKVFLTPGTYTITFSDTIKNTTKAYYSRIRNVELSSDWLDVELAYAGTLGVEILHLVDVLNDVTLLKIKGALGDADWTHIKQMNNLVGLDLSEAIFTSVPNYAFDGLSWLSSVKLPEGVTSIGEYAFRGTQIRKIEIPSTVTSIAQYAFAETPLERIIFPETSQLKSIGYQAFYQCTSLREFIMPNTVTSLGTYSSYSSKAFYGCTNLTKLHFSESLTNLRSYTCYGCTALRDVILPIKVTTIGDYAFYNNTNLHTIDFPESLRTIGDEAFYQCGLDSVKLPIKLSTLGEYAFYNCDSLRYIELPSHISHYNVNFYDCDSINTIVCPAATPPLIASNPLSNGASKSNITLYVPSFALLNYKLDNYWYGFGEILPMDEDPIDWTIGSDMTLYNDSPIKVEPNVKLTYGEDNNARYSGSLTVNGNETLSMRYFYIPWSHNNQYVYPDDPKNYCALINNSSLRADSIEITIANRNDIWTFVTFPYDVKISDITFTYSGSTNYVIRKYDGQKRADGETNSTWVLLSQEDTLHAGVGYIMQSSRYVGSEWQYYSGFSMPAINNTNKNKIFINTDATVVLNEYQSEFAHNRGWNLIGNPYPSYYDTRFMDFNAPITIWDMDNSTYRAYSPLDDEYILCPGESFFVQCPVDNKNIVFSKEGRQINRVVRSLSALPAKKQFTGANASRTVINLALSDGEHTDKTRVVLNENATVQYDMDKDASKFMSEDANIPQLYTTYNDVQYAINERPFADGVVDLCTRIRTSGTYTITLQNSIDDYTIYLLDKELNQTILLSEHIGYSFVADAGESAGRFELHFKSNTTTDLEQTTDNNISPEDGEIYTIMGVQVKQATVPGIYIQNGKKFIVQ